MRHPLVLALALLCPLLVTTAARAQTLPDKKATFGAFASPAALPSGATSAYAFIGAPEVGGGYRMGFSGLEIDARVRFDYFSLAGALEGHLRYPVLQREKLQLAPSLGLGIVGNTGARYIDDENFSYVGARVIPGALLSYRVAETANLIGEATVPMDFSLSPTGGWRVNPLIGGGGEIYVGEDISAAAVALFGADVIKEPLGVSRSRFAFSFRVGLGYRFF